MGLWTRRWTQLCLTLLHFASMNSKPKPLLAVAEIWRVEAAGLKLERGFYGAYSELLKTRVNKRFDVGEGLPGRVAQTKTPLLSPLAEPEFAGLDAVIALPFMPKGEVEAVVVMFFAVDEGKLAAEFWEPSALGTLSAAQSIYVNLEGFASQSEGSSFAVLEGLPSRAFDHKEAVLLSALNPESGFVRSQAAAAAGLDAALGLPILNADKVTGSLLLFTSVDSPLFAVLEHWRFKRSKLELVTGVYSDPSLKTDTTFKAGEDLVGQAYTQKRPILLTSLAPGSGFARAEAATAAGLKTALALPIMRKNRVTDVVVVIA